MVTELVNGAIILELNNMATIDLIAIKQSHGCSRVPCHTCHSWYHPGFIMLDEHCTHNEGQLTHRGHTPVSCRVCASRDWQTPCVMQEGQGQRGTQSLYKKKCIRKKRKVRKRWRGGKEKKRGVNEYAHFHFIFILSKSQKHQAGKGVALWEGPEKGYVCVFEGSCQRLMFCVVSSVRVLEVADVWRERGVAPLFIYVQKTREIKLSLDWGSSRKINKKKAERHRDASKIHQQRERK